MRADLEQGRHDRTLVRGEASKRRLAGAPPTLLAQVFAEIAKQLYAAPRPMKCWNASRRLLLRLSLAAALPASR